MWGGTPERPKRECFDKPKKQNERNFIVKIKISTNKKDGYPDELYEDIKDVVSTFLSRGFKDDYLHPEKITIEVVESKN